MHKINLKKCCIYKKEPYICTRNTISMHDSIAQLVEHNTFNVGVLGSSPSRVTFLLFMYLLQILFFDSIAQLVEHNTFNVGVLGSSPSRVTSRDKSENNRFVPFLFLHNFTDNLTAIRWR